MISEREAGLLDPEARRLLDAYRKGLHPALLHEVDQLLKAGKGTPGVLGICALSCMALERYDEAVAAAESAIAKAPDWAWLYAALAGAKAAQKHPEEALKAQIRATQLMPGEAGYAATLARYYRESGQLDQALKTVRQALVTHPDHPDALNELGIILLLQGDAAGALAQFRQAQAAAPEAPEGYLNEGGLHLRAGDRGAARQAFRAALKRVPGLTPAEDGLADCMAGPAGPMRALLGHLLTLGRLKLIGWLMVAFIYYVTFRVFQIVWRLVPATLPFFQALLWATLVWLAGGFAVGRLLRLGMNAGARSQA